METKVRMLVKSSAVALLAAAGLAACGGGGGGGGEGGGGAPPALYRVGGTVTGLSGTMTLQNSGADNLTVAANGPFTFATALATASAYAVTVLSPPAGQTCVVANASGTVASANVTNVGLSCSALPPPPPPAPPASGARVGAGGGYTLAVRADGAVLAFGSGMQGGSGAAVPGTAARAISGLSGAAAVWAGPLPFEPSLALAANGTVFGWGQSLLGASVTGGYGLVVDAPIAVGLLGSAKQVAVCPGPSLPITYALRADGSVAYVPATSLVANNGVRTSTAKSVAGLGSVIAMSEHCADDTVHQMTVVKSDGTVWNLTPSFSVAAGPAPYVSTTMIDIAVAQVIGLPPIASVSCGISVRYCLARTIDGHVWAWGDNTYGQLGDGTTTGRTVPIQVPGLASVAQVVAGAVASYAVATDGSAFSWGGGSGNSLYLGRAVNADAALPKPVTLRAKVVGMAASTQHVVVQLLDGSLWGWGANAFGELGDGSSGNSSALPVQALGINLN